MQSLMKSGERRPEVISMRYNSRIDELFLADSANNIVRVMRLRDNCVNRSEYTATHEHVFSVCQMTDSDTLFLCSRHQHKSWLVALSRGEDRGEWREAHRMQLQSKMRKAMISFALSDSRMLIGELKSKYLDLFLVLNAQKIVFLIRLVVQNNYRWFSATSSSDTLVAMSHKSDNLVRIHRLRGNVLEELMCIKFHKPDRLLWLGDRLLVTNGSKSHAITELKVSGTRLERRRLLIAPGERVNVQSWCAVDDGIAIVEGKSKNIIHYKF